MPCSPCQPSLQQPAGSSDDASLRAWLVANDLGEFQGAFSRAGIGPDMLALLGDEELRQMGIAKLGPRRRILGTIQASVQPQVTCTPRLNFLLKVRQELDGSSPSPLQALWLPRWSPDSAGPPLRKSAMRY